MLAHGWPMIAYEGFQALFQMLKIKSVFEKHWFEM
jgi:hypothetical protein